MRNSESITRKVITVLFVVLGNVLYALTVKLFLMPADLMVGGTTGIAFIVRKFTGMEIPNFVLVFNIVMLLWGLAVLGKKFAVTTVISTFAYPIALGVFDRLLGNVVLTEDMWLCTVFSGLGIGVALGGVIRFGASTGGMDIPPLILNRRFRIPVSVSLYAFDFIILLFQAVYNPPEKVLYGLILLLIYTTVLNKILLFGTTRTEVKIVSRHHQKIREAIIHQLDRGVTMLSGEGGYMGEETQMVFSVISNRELPQIEKIVREIDPDGFMVVSQVSEVRGRGFSMKKKYQ